MDSAMRAVRRTARAPLAALLASALLLGPARAEPFLELLVAQGGAPDSLAQALRDLAPQSTQELIPGQAVPGVDDPLADTLLYADGTAREMSCSYHGPISLAAIAAQLAAYPDPNIRAAMTDLVTPLPEGALRRVVCRIRVDADPKPFHAAVAAWAEAQIGPLEPVPGQGKISRDLAQAGTGAPLMLSLGWSGETPAASLVSLVFDVPM